MAWKRSVLVLANITAASDELLEALRRKSEAEPATFTLIIPASPLGEERAAAAAKLQEALDRLHAAGLEADGSVGDCDPLVAVTEAWDPKRYDEIVVSTLPMKFSKWLAASLPARIGKMTDAPVTHVVSQPPRPRAQPTPVPPHHESGILSPLEVLGWGKRSERRRA
jgi:GABA permease